jgi:hypothetical protein
MKIHKPSAWRKRIPASMDIINSQYGSAQSDRYDGKGINQLTTEAHQNGGPMRKDWGATRRAEKELALQEKG